MSRSTPPGERVLWRVKKEGRTAGAVGESQARGPRASGDLAASERSSELALGGSGSGHHNWSIVRRPETRGGFEQACRPREAHSPRPEPASQASERVKRN
jgi:hypothetical protein